jgi:hypothetical protein
VRAGGAGAREVPGAATNFTDTWVFEDPPTRRLPRTKDECKRGGWSDLARADGTAFKNQGACVSYVNTGK